LIKKSPEIPYSAIVREVEFVSVTRSPPRVNQFVAQSYHQVAIKSADYFCSNPARRQKD